MRKHPLTLPVIACVLILAVAGGWALLHFENSGPGPLTGPVPGATTIIVYHLRQPATIGDARIFNRTGSTAVVDSIEPMHVPPGLAVNAGLMPVGKTSQGAMQGSPAELGMNVSAPDGYVISSHTNNTELVVTLKIIGKPGRYILPGLNVHYHVGSSSHTLAVNESMGICYPLSVWKGRCFPPSPTSTG